MSQTAIPIQFEQYIQERINAGLAPDMNEMIFAYIPDLNLSAEIDRTTGLPDQSTWVHQQDVDQAGKVGESALAYSVVIPSSVAAFTFNAIYLHDKNTPNSCGVIVHKATETKEDGMSSTKSLLQAYSGAAELTGITVDAETWQIDYQARLTGIDEDHRVSCLDIYGEAAFIDGFDFSYTAETKKIKIDAGLAYIGGLRATTAEQITLTLNTTPQTVYIDVYRDGSALSSHINNVSLVSSNSNLSDYTDENGKKHYLAPIVTINENGSTTDHRSLQSSVFERTSNAATDADIQNQATSNKHIKLPQFWSALNMISPIGVPLPWPTDTAPENFAIMKGQSFDVNVYTELAKVYPEGIIDDMRGLAIVGKKDGELIRAYEADGNKAHNHPALISSVDLGTKETSTDIHDHEYIGSTRGVKENAVNNADGRYYMFNDGTTYETNKNEHNHTVELGEHAHDVTISMSGNTENTIKNRKFNWIVRLA